jgi:hypothetical protein
MRNILNYLKKWTSFSPKSTTQVNPSQSPSRETTTPETNATAKNKKDRMHGSSGKKKKHKNQITVEFSVDPPLPISSQSKSQSQSRSDDAAVFQVSQPKKNQTSHSRSDDAENKLPKSSDVKEKLTQKNPKFNLDTINSYFEETGEEEDKIRKNSISSRGGRGGGRGGRGGGGRGGGRGGGAVGKGEGASSSHRGGRGKNIKSVVNKDPILPGWTKPIVLPKPIAPPNKASKLKPSPILSGWTTPIVLPRPLGAPIVPPGPIGPPSKVEKQHGSNTMFDFPYQLNLRPKST